MEHLCLHPANGVSYGTVASIERGGLVTEPSRTGGTHHILSTCTSTLIQNIAFAEDFIEIEAVLSIL